MRILTYSLPREILAYRKLVEAAGWDQTVISDQKGVGDLWVMERFYRHYHDPRLDARLANPLSDLTMAHIVYRCRFLRLLPMTQARRMALAGFATLRELIEEVGPDAVICRPVDYYLNDIFMRLVEERGLPAFSPCDSQAPGMSLLTHRGEAHRYRDVGEDEVDALLAQFRQPSHHALYAYQPSRSVAHQVKRIAEFRLRDLYRAALRTASRDPLNFHYNLASFDSLPRRLRDFPKGELPRALPARRGDRPRVFVPLAWTPEMSTDYWCPGFEPVLYNDFILGLAEKLGRDSDLIVKDHPNMVGLRPAGVGEALQATPGVTMMDPRMPATDIMDACDLVLVGTGTPGLQALARGKPVLRFGHVFWADDRNSLFLSAKTLLRTPNEAIAGAVSAHAAARDAEAAGRSAVRRLLESSIPGHLSYRPIDDETRTREVRKGLPFVEAILTGAMRRSPLVAPEDAPAEDVLSRAASEPKPDAPPARMAAE